MRYLLWLSASYIMERLIKWVSFPRIVRRTLPTVFSLSC
ncbi:hypothetical protein EVA_13599 [gut metagenome]|uniref:Uncharacterized protein n=1 Tax=gut metagenome TaxID=749906 RepID=J9FTL0_9ZZZZ